jgi:hypothetical protein
MKAMILHQPTAIDNAENAGISDPRVRRLMRERCAAAVRDARSSLYLFN